MELRLNKLSTSAQTSSSPRSRLVPPLGPEKGGGTGTVEGKAAKEEGGGGGERAGPEQVEKKRAGGGGVAKEEDEDGERA